MAEVDEHTKMVELTTVSELNKPTKEEMEQLVITQYIEKHIKILKSNIERSNERLNKTEEFWVNKQAEIETELMKDKELLKSFIMILEYHNKNLNIIKSDIKVEPKPKYKKQTISLALKKLVWDKHICLDIGRTKCVCCKTSEIIQISFHAGHIIAESKGGKTNVSNLKPICQNCNCSMGSINMDDFEKSFIGRRRRGWYIGRLFSLSSLCK
jgi:hypothetical protein